MNTGSSSSCAAKVVLDLKTLSDHPLLQASAANLGEEAAPWQGFVNMEPGPGCGLCAQPRWAPCDAVSILSRRPGSSPCSLNDQRDAGGDCDGLRWMLQAAEKGLSDTGSRGRARGSWRMESRRAPRRRCRGFVRKALSSPADSQ